MRWAVVGLLSLGMVIAYIDRVNLTAAMPVIGSIFGLDKTQQGLALSAFFWTYTLFQIPCGLLVDRLRRAHALLHRVPCCGLWRRPRSR